MRLIFLKCGASLVLTLVVSFIGCPVTFRFPSSLAIPTYFLKALMSTYVRFSLVVFILRFSPQAWMNTSFHGIYSHLGRLPSGIAGGWMDHLHVCTSPPALSVSCQPGVSTGSDTVRLPCQSLWTFNYWAQGPISSNIIFDTTGKYWQVIFFPLRSLWPEFNGTLLKGD